MSDKEFYFNVERLNGAQKSHKQKLTVRLAVFSVIAFVLYALYYSASIVLPGMMAEAQFKTSAMLTGLTAYIIGGLALVTGSLSLFSSKQKHRWQITN